MYFQALDALLDISGMGWCTNAEDNSTRSPDIFPGYGIYEEISSAMIDQSSCQVVASHSYNLSSYSSVLLLQKIQLILVTYTLAAIVFIDKYVVLQIAWEHRLFIST
jgi:hypothetical protein